MDGPPADIWYSQQHRHAACCLLHLKPRSLAKYSDFNISFVLQFMAFTAVFRGFLGRKIKRRKIKKSSFFGSKKKTKFGRPLAPYIIIYNKYGMSHLLLYSTTIFLSRWWESIPIGIGVITIPILIDSHSHSHCLFNFCTIPMGLPFPLGFPFPCTSLVWTNLRDY